MERETLRQSLRPGCFLDSPPDSVHRMYDTALEEIVLLMLLLLITHEILFQSLSLPTRTISCGRILFRISLLSFQRCEARSRFQKAREPDVSSLAYLRKAQPHDKPRDVPNLRQNTYCRQWPFSLTATRTYKIE